MLEANSHRRSRDDEKKASPETYFDTFYLAIHSTVTQNLDLAGPAKNIGLATRLPIPTVGGGMRARCYFDNLYILGSKSLHLPKFSKHGERRSR